MMTQLSRCRDRATECWWFAKYCSAFAGAAAPLFCNGLGCCACRWGFAPATDGATVVGRTASGGTAVLDA